jgi:hypothetical protein
MSKKKQPEKQPPELTQETPAGAMIPIPSEEDFFRDLAKVAKPQKKSAERCAEDKD